MIFELQTTHGHSHMCLDSDFNCKKRPALRDLSNNSHPSKKPRADGRVFEFYKKQKQTNAKSKPQLLQPSSSSSSSSAAASSSAHAFGVLFKYSGGDSDIYAFRPSSSLPSVSSLLNPVLAVSKKRRIAAPEPSSSCCSFDRLPTETVLYIFTFMPTCQDSLKARGVCRAWDRLLRDVHLRRIVMYPDDVMRQAEPFYLINHDYMSSVQHDITPGMRSILVDWLVEVADEFSFQTETLFLCVNYIDRFLSVVPVAKGQLQLLGVTCMILAAKYEETEVPRVEEFVIISDNACTREEIFKMELAVLSRLKFSVSAVTSRAFLTKYLAAVPVTDTLKNIVRNLSYYFVELTLGSYPMVIKHPPSLIAASALCLALHSVGFTAWTHTLEIFCQYSISDSPMQLVCDQLLALFAGARSSCISKAVFEKYCQPRFGCVAGMPIPTYLPRQSSVRFGLLS